MRVGLASREGSGLLMNRVVPREQDQSRIGSEYLHLVRTLGVEPGEFRMEMAIGDRDGQYARRLREQHGITGRYAVFSPFTTRPHKHWLEDRWAELARLLSSEQGISTTLLVGADGDVAAAGRIESLSGGLALNIAGRTTLKEAAAVIRDASVLVGVDTGLTHMGIALGVPVVAVFGATLPYTDTASENATVLYKKMQCSPCNKRPTCEGSTVCMEAVTARDVMEAVAEVLGAGKR